MAWQDHLKVREPFNPETATMQDCGDAADRVWYCFSSTFFVAPLQIQANTLAALWMGG
jgi:hypothetical protein